ncbi:MAG: hypothetical protein ACRC6E_03120 [Fusobacteriaceae bacterium]
MIGYVTLEEAKEFLSLRYDGIISDGVFESHEFERKFILNLQLAFDKIEMMEVRDRGLEAIFPRLGELEIPKNIKFAQILEAYSLSTNKFSEVNDNVISKSIGDYSVTYKDTKINGVEYINKMSFDILRKYRRRTY